ncbi:MAG: protein kinase [Archangium sp.]
MAELEFKIEVPDRGRVVAFPSKQFVIGSADDCALCFKSELVAPRHAEVMKDQRGQWWVRDLVGNGAVAVNNTPIIDERLSIGDKLRIGDVVMVIQDTGVNAHARTRSGDAIPAVARSQAAQALTQPEGATPTDSQPVFGPGTVIDSRYRVISKLAEGGMGEVYRAEHVELGKALAIKVMLPELSTDQEFVGRFKREAIASSRIGHPNIIDISDFGRTNDGRFYFVMEFVEGKTLIKYRKEGPFRFERVVHVGLQIGRALAAAHAVNIIHRDLKPENIMLVQRPGQPDFVKVLDFGIAKVLGSGASGAFTAIGSVVGTPQYMAPEQASAGVVDTRSDIYSMGLILHELVRGRPTFTGDSAVELMSRQLDTLPPALKSPWGNVPAPLERIIMQMLQKDPAQRPASMEAVVSALEAVQSTPTPTRTEPVTAVDLPPAPLQLTSSKAVPAPPKPLSSVEKPVAKPVEPPKPKLGETRLEVLTPPDVPALLSPTIPPVASTKYERAPHIPSPTTNPTPVDQQQATNTARLLRRKEGAGAEPAPDSNVDLAAVRPNRTPLIIGLMLIVGGLIGAVIWVFTRPPEGDVAKPAPPIATKPPPPETVIDAGADAVALVDPPSEPKPNNANSTPAPGGVKLAIESASDRVEVFEDDFMLGTTPFTLSRPQGTITSLRFVSKGFVTQTRKVRFESDTSLRIDLAKEKGSSGTGKKPPSGKPPPPGDDDLKDLPF